MKAIAFPFKAVYFVLRWTAYVICFPFGIWSLLRRHGKKTRQRRMDDLRAIRDEAR